MSLTLPLQIHQPNVVGAAPPVEPEFGNNSREFVSANNQYIGVPSFTYGSTFSIALWVKNTTMQTQLLVARSDATAVRVQFFMSADAQIWFRIRDENNNWMGRYSNTGVCEIDKWNHAVATYEGGISTDQLKIYVNDVQVDNFDDLQGPFASFDDSPRPTEIGAQLEGTSAPFDGRLADVRLYKNKVLSAAEITDLSNLVHVPDGLEGWWITDNDDVNDYSGQDNNGVNNGTTFSTDGPRTT